ncbi:MAG: hypothetical protein COS88_00390 [Chloroflexi bacterium CG07_land_8_20_14_0_80_51_10]|nr:MAG: hypothetical protein COS88_00390 [Chloroflexi bacterium CG07_land_8_20_14_0_80_51_10]
MLISRYKQIINLALAILICSLLLTGCATNRFQPQGWAGPMVAEGILYAGSMKGKIVALDVSSRNKVWEFTPEAPQSATSPLLGCAPSSPSTVIYGTPAVAADMVYFGDYKGKVYALDAESGVKRWDYTTDGPIIGSPAIAGNAVVVGSSDGKLYALDAQTGASLWNEPFATEGEIWCDPVVADNLIYFGNLDHKLYAVDLESGQLVWERDFEGAIASTPLVVEGRLYIGTFESKFYALDAATGGPKWVQPFEAENWFWTKPAFSEGTIYVGSLDSNIYALDAKTGGRKWAKQTGGEIRSAAVIVDGVLVVASNDGKVYGLDPRNGNEKWAPRDLDVPILAHPWTEENKVYLADQKNMLHALEAETGREIWSTAIE